MTATDNAVVVAAFGKQLLIAAEGELLRASLAKRRLGAVCGDMVQWHRDGERAVVTAVEDRESELLRRDASGRDRRMAANLDQVLILFASEPAPYRILIDHCLIGAELAAQPATLLQTKSDIDSEDCRQLVRDYANVGYTQLETSVETGAGLEALKAKLAGRCTMLLGPSGVGKSSLVNVLVPDAGQRVGAISEATGGGKHTTTAGRLFDLPGGGTLIDTPGVREFHPPLDGKRALDDCFPEFRPALGHCRFSDCRHRAEPQCAVQQRVSDGEISASRYQRYLALLERNESALKEN